MAYSTVAEVRQLLEGLKESQGNELGADYTPDKLSDEQIEYEIKNADEEINIALRRHYNLPLPTPLPTILNTLSVDIAASLSDMTFRASREYNSELSPFRLRYERARLLVERIAEGTYTIYDEGEVPTEAEQVGGGALVVNVHPPVLVTRDAYQYGNPFVGRRSYYGGGEGEFGETIYEDIPYNRNYHDRWW